MRRSFPWILLVIPLWAASPSMGEAPSPAPTPIPRLETYVMASQVDSLLSTPEGLESPADVPGNRITKIYLESLRCGYKSNLEIRNKPGIFSKQYRGLGGITTAAGEGLA